jgi:heme/copper-type cytochrome/quinol oxidase subunit 3
LEQVHLKGHESEHETSLGIPHRKLLIWVFLASECMFFGSLIATYLVYQGKSLVGPYPHDVFSIPITSVSTFVLLVSSMSMVLAYSAISRGNIKVFRIWILSTAILGACFIGFQVFEFREFAVEGLTPRTNLFGTTFFTLTGFHGAHVTVGVIWLLSIFGFSFFKKFTSADSLSVDLVALYWHFVDVVWIVIFTVVYLIGVVEGG